MSSRIYQFGTVIPMLPPQPHYSQPVRRYLLLPTTARKSTELFRSSLPNTVENDSMPRLEWYYERQTRIRKKGIVRLFGNHVNATTTGLLTMFLFVEFVIIISAGSQYGSLAILESPLVLPGWMAVLLIGLIADLALVPFAIKAKNQANRLSSQRGPEAPAEAQ